MYRCLMDIVLKLEVIRAIHLRAYGMHDQQHIPHGRYGKHDPYGSNEQHAYGYAYKDSYTSNQPHVDVYQRQQGELISAPANRMYIE